MMLYELNKEEYTKMFCISKTSICEVKVWKEIVKGNDDSMISKCEVDMIL